MRSRRSGRSTDARNLWRLKRENKKRLSLANTIGAPLTQDTFTFDPKLPSYDYLNLRLGVVRGPWDIALFLNNVTNERALLALDQERGTLARVGYLNNRPRSFGISSKFRF